MTNSEHVQCYMAKPDLEWHALIYNHFMPLSVNIYMFCWRNIKKLFVGWCIFEMYVSILSKCDESGIPKHIWSQVSKQNSLSKMYDFHTNAKWTHIKDFIQLINWWGNRKDGRVGSKENLKRKKWCSQATSGMLKPICMNKF